MSGKEVVVTWIVGVASAALPAFSQSENPEKNVVSVQAFGSFTAIITAVKPTTAIRLNTQSYGSTSGVQGMKGYSHEVSAAYVFRIPMRKFTPFVLAGAGGLIFDPKDFVGASSQARAITFLNISGVSTLVEVL